MNPPLRLAIIGGGTISEIMHIPAALSSIYFKLNLVCDINEYRLSYLKDKFQLAQVSTSYDTHINEFDAAIIATSNNTHKSIAIDLLQRGKHVFIEKPLAESLSSCEEIIAETKKYPRLVATVGQIKRCYPNFNFIKELINNKDFGALKSIAIEDGRMFSYPMSSDFFLKKEKAGGGVMIDVGVHFLDLVFWWLGQLELVEYYDDALPEGIEADCNFNGKSKSGINFSIMLSRQRNLKNTISLQFEKVKVIIPSGFSDYISFSFSNGTITHSKISSITNVPYLQNNIIQLERFAHSVINNSSPDVPVEEAYEVLKLIATAYTQKKLVLYEWE